MDLLLDGFVAPPFTQGRFAYFNLLFGIGVRHSPGVPLQTTPLLDYALANPGTVVPQRRWTPADEVDVRRYVEDATLLLPVFFVSRNGSIGFPLSDILRGCDRELRNPNDFAPLGGRCTTQIRINWPGYNYWKRQIATRDETRDRNPITVARLMRHVGTSVDRFFTECMANGAASTVPRWQIGMQGGITQAHVKVVGVIHVSAGSWMPILQLDGYMI
ncbi:hypothetical protein EI94DRAFT_1791524 [Lactarius quietus]|nr:hypothetical protein EI94DRAFT_1791524 [Lactarius quietus]